MMIEIEKEELFMLLKLIRGRVGMLIQMSAVAEISTDIRAEVQKRENLGKKIENQIYKHECEVKKGI